MDAPTFHATRFVQPVLRVVVLYLSIIVISSITMIKPAQAEGTVAPVAASASSFREGSVFYSSRVDACQAITNAVFAASSCPYPSDRSSSGCAFGGYASQLTNQSRVNPANNYCQLGYMQWPLVGDPNSFTTWVLKFYDVFYLEDLGGTSCPTNSTGTPTTNPTTCTCNSGYQPDPTATSCVSGQYTLSLQTLNEIEPSDSTFDNSATVIATVVDAQTQQPKAGVTVSINVDVVANSGGHNHDDGRHVSPYTGTLDTTTGTTGSDGTVSFTFTAPEVSGTHIFTATCVQPTCTNNPATTQIDVKVDGLAPIPSSVFYRFISPNADTNHPDNHNLKPEASAKLAAIAKAYYEATYLFKDGWIPNVMLNDASLKWGGILDCFLTCINTDPPSVPWGPAHGEHRRGSVVDIRARLPAVNDPNNPSADTLLYADKFIEIALKAGADPYPEGSHYHLRLFGIRE